MPQLHLVRVVSSAVFVPAAAHDHRNRMMLWNGLLLCQEVTLHILQQVARHARHTYSLLLRSTALLLPSQNGTSLFSAGSAPNILEGSREAAGEDAMSHRRLVCTQETI